MRASAYRLWGCRMAQVSANSPALLDRSVHREARGLMAIAACGIVMILALVVGVGVPGHMVLRHVVQTMPVMVVAGFGLRRSRAATWMGLPVFLFWFAVMGLIWLHLLGIAHVITGTFTPLESAMTLVVGLAALAGFVLAIRTRGSMSALKAFGLLVVLGALQFACFVVSFRPEIAHR